MYWNLRMVDMSHDNQGDPLIEICEVFYDDDDRPMGYAKASLMGETEEELAQYIKWCIEAMKDPVLKQSDFDGKELEKSDVINDYKLN